MKNRTSNSYSSGCKVIIFNINNAISVLPENKKTPREKSQHQTPDFDPNTRQLILILTPDQFMKIRCYI